MEEPKSPHLALSIQSACFLRSLHSAILVVFLQQVFDREMLERFELPRQQFERRTACSVTLQEIECSNYAQYLVEFRLVSNQERLVIEHCAGFLHSSLCFT